MENANFTHNIYKLSNQDGKHFFFYRGGYIKNNKELLKFNDKHLNIQNLNKLTRKHFKNGDKFSVKRVETLKGKTGYDVRKRKTELIKASRKISKRKCLNVCRDQCIDPKVWHTQYYNKKKKDSIWYENKINLSKMRSEEEKVIRCLCKVIFLINTSKNYPSFS